MTRVASDRSDRFTLNVPSDPAYVATARMFSSTVARHFGAGEDEIDDLKLAVSEACSASMRDGIAPGGVRVTAIHEAPLLWFEVSWPEAGVAGDYAPTPDHAAAGLGLEIVRALFENAELSRSEGGDAVIRFSLPVSA